MKNKWINCQHKTILFTFNLLEGYDQVDESEDTNDY